MAVATVTLTVTNTWSDGKRQHVIGTVGISPAPDTYATGGLAADIKDPLIKSTKLRWVSIRGAAILYQYIFVASTTKIKIFDLVFQTELAAAAIPADVSNDIIDFYGIFDQLR